MVINTSPKSTKVRNQRYCLIRDYNDGYKPFFRGFLKPPVRLDCTFAKQFYAVLTHPDFVVYMIEDF